MSPLAEALRQISETSTEGIVAYWIMHNGAQFWMAIPSIEDIQNNSFSQNIEFPFQFDEIEKFGVIEQFFRANLDLRCDLNTIFAQLCTIDSLKLKFEYQTSIGGEPKVDLLWIAQLPPA